MTKVLMRKIELKPDMGVETIVDSSYRALLITVFETPKNRQGAGATIKEMREVKPVLDMLYNAKIGESILLTESQWADAKSRLATQPWARNFIELITFEDDIIAAPEVPLEEVSDDAFDKEVAALVEDEDPDLV